MFKSFRNKSRSTLLILSSDHKIENEENFKKTIELGLNHAAKGRLVTFGISPEHPETGYGYIESFDELSNNNNSSEIKRFIEKPKLEFAENLIKDKHFVWNSGIFLFRASVVLKELNKFEPEIIKICKESIKKGSVDLDFYRISKEVFEKCPNKPFDIAVMEKTSLGTVMRLDAGWDDIGSWKSIWKNSKKDPNGNSLKGKILNFGSTNCYLRSERRLIAGIELNDLVVVETNDAILISKKDATQKLKELVNELNERLS